MIAIATLLLVLALSILITRVARVALIHTGLSRESARFQARSAFTGVGFTTSESEKVVNHPVRRRILLILMLLGNAGIVTALSSLILSFVNVSSTTPLVWRIVLLAAGIVVLWAAASRAARG
jgi:Trk-type K+ transport system membrane component